MELKQLSENVFYIPNTTNIGVIVKSSEAVLIDSGLDDDTGKKLLKVLENAGLQLKAIINTHSHADHIGGNSFLAAKTGAKIYAPDYEASIIRYPYLEPFFLFSGAHPMKDLRNKFLMAKPAAVDYTISTQENLLGISGINLGIVPLPGHALNQIGVEFEGTLFCADAVFSEDVLVKHKIPFCVDISKQKETLDILYHSDYKLYVPSHAAPSDSLGAVVSAYRQTIENLEVHILELSAEAKSTEEVLAELCSLLNITIKSSQQFYLLQTSVMAYLSYLYEQGSLKIELKENRLLWSRT